MGFIEGWLKRLNEKKGAIETELEEIGVDIEKIKERIPQTYFTLNKKSLKQLKVACIMDGFSYDSYKEECELKQVTPDGWKQEIEEFKPDFLFVESAWQGKDNLWYRKIANISKEYFELTGYCQNNGIPVVFWNKEDPVWTDTFLPAAKCADVVFTTDIDCIKKYKECLNSERVYLLHFAAQPKVHNPIEKYERKDKFCFAGAYYHRYPKRAQVFDKFSKIFLDLKGFDIYDRNFQNSRPEHAFPDIYTPYILGRLEPGEIDIAYKGYYYGVNMNSVDQSQTMFARRVFEMLASNTVTVGNFSRGVKNFFGDLTICTNDDVTLKSAILDYCSDENTYRKYRLLGLRKVLQEHLYEDRLAYIVQKVFGIDLRRELPIIKLVMCAEDDCERGIQIFHKLDYPNKMLYIISDRKKETENEKIVYITYEEAKKIKVADFIKGGMIGTLDPSNYYGKNYLLDLSLTRRYSSAAGFGKAGYYKWNGEEFVFEGKEKAYKTVNRLLTDRSLFSAEIELFHELSLHEFAEAKYVESQELLSTDEFNFCETYIGDCCEIVEDLNVVDQGLGMLDMENSAEKIKVSVLEDNGHKISHEQIYMWSKSSWKDGIASKIANEGLAITSSLKAEEKKYIYLNQNFELADYIKNNKLNIFFGGRGTVGFLGVCVFYDANGSKLAPVFPVANVLSSYDIPEGAKTFKLGIRLVGNGTYMLQQIILGLEKNPKELSRFISRGNVLILTNNYPSPENLYRNMFVHKRVKAYKEENMLCDIMQWTSYSQDMYREFERINVVSGQAETLTDILLHGKIDTICVHFMNAQMWETLQSFAGDKRIIVWFHGAEVQPWWRRTCNYTNKEEEENARKLSEGRENLWKDIFSKRERYNIHFVFVSHQFKEEVCEDYHVTLEENEYSIIHNCVDTDLFSYIPKDSEQRKKILSVRPYAAPNYANDLTVKCILELAKRDFFGELQFALYGDGILYEETVKPLKKYKNVSLHRCFLRQDEIAALHKQYGVLLIPTRLDTQGVSRDEGMASGLVPVTNAVAAVPEFADSSCGIVVPGEDYKAMADGIEKLYHQPEYFLKLSENARKRVEKQTAKEHTIKREMRLIQGVD